ncbi:MAG: tRNA pseudouridine(38-40) synthase TruA [Bacillota bacterium]
MKRRIKLLLSYDGTNYAGWQIQTGQPHVKTIQGQLERALTVITKGKLIRVYGAGRTDSGVHARGQVCHFDFPGLIPIDRFPTAINSILPRDIRCHLAEEVDEDFHAQHSAKYKTYSYSINQSYIADVFLRNYYHHEPYPLRLKAMKEAGRLLVGRMDFKGFSATGSSQEDFIRTVTELTIEQTGDKVLIKVTGDGFLYNMVRIMAGTLIAIGRGKMMTEAIEKILQTKDRAYAGPTAAAKGLCLERIIY